MTRPTPSRRTENKMKTVKITDNTLNRRCFSRPQRASVYSGVYRQKIRISVLIQFDNRCRRRGCLHRRCIGCEHFLAAFSRPNSIRRPSSNLPPRARTEPSFCSAGLYLSVPAMQTFTARSARPSPGRPPLWRSPAGLVLDRPSTVPCWRKAGREPSATWGVQPGRTEWIRSRHDGATARIWIASILRFRCCPASDGSTTAASRFSPDTLNPAAVLAAVKDTPFGRP
jgi:hypothetical protein